MAWIGKSNKRSEFIILPDDGELNLSILLEQLNWARDVKWIKTELSFGQFLQEIGGKSRRPFVGQVFDENYFELVNSKDSDYERCCLCTRKQWQKDVVFKSNNDILCSFCFDNFVNVEDLNESISKFEIVLK